MNILLGGLVGVIALIFYEQYEKKKVSAASQSASPSGTIPTQNVSQGTLVSPSAGAPMLYGNSSPSNTSNLPVFSAANYPTLIDTSAVPIWDGKNWNCPNGEIAYYDPSAGTVYCLLPGTVPGGANPPDTSSAIPPSETWAQTLEDFLPY